MNPAIPFYKNPAIIGIIVGILSQVLALFGKSVPTDVLTSNVDSVMQVISLLALAFSALHTVRSKAQPLTLTAKGADNHPQTIQVVAAATAKQVLKTEVVGGMIHTHMQDGSILVERPKKPTTATAIAFLAGFLVMLAIAPAAVRANEEVVQSSPAQELILGGKRAAGVTVAPADHSGDMEKPTVVSGHPLTSVIVTQCNLIVAVYMTMPDGRLLRFDNSANVPSDQLMEMAYQADRSERIEVSCNDVGEVGHERRDPV